MNTLFVTANNTTIHAYKAGEGNNKVLLIHGNGSDGSFWKPLLDHCPENVQMVAPDIRNYGKSKGKPIEAVRSMGDVVDDFLMLINELGWESYHIAAHSLGGSVTWEMLLKDSARIKSVTVVNPASPFGFGGTHGVDGALNFPNGEGSGGGVVNPDFVERIKADDRTTGSDNSPLNVMNSYYWEPPFVPKDIDVYLNGLMAITTGDEHYPGDFSASDNYPFTKPGNYGPLNAASPLTKQNILAELTNLEHKPKILWVRGGKDKIVSDTSFFDTAYLGTLGAIPGYPGEDVCPPQPMVSQTRHVLDAYQANGGSYKEEVFENCGHSPYIEEEQRFRDLFYDWIA